MTGPTRRRRTPATRRPVIVDPSDSYQASPVEPVDPAVARRWERIVAALFLLSAGCTVGFSIAYFVIKLKGIDSVQASNFTLGLMLTGMVGFLGFGLVLWTKKLMPHFDLVEERHPFASTDEDRANFVETFNQGADETGIKNYKVLRRSLLMAAAVLPAPIVFLLRDMGPLPHNTLRHTRWTKGARLVDIVTQQPVHVGDLEVGGLMTVMPEGVEVNDTNAATSPTMLVRLRPGENHPLPGRSTWAPEGYIAYNKICTHAGCPISLYEQQTHLLFCPCHQSTFDVVNGCKVVFGPAARSLPQLPIYVDSKGYLRAQSDFREPVGPSFWERG
jgi:quinol---cytochrome c reductase iron-sulfur subunit